MFKFQGFASLNDRFEGYYTNYPYRLASDVMNRPICGVPGAIVDVLNRQTSDEGWTYTWDFFFLIFCKINI